eukprot:Hpha_TRINITY_DN13615_c0_g1::TRINITY_DN13615_c0_g1_i1::g.122457::m.122457/K01494/dcd; dCTP deaminase
MMRRPFLALVDTNLRSLIAQGFFCSDSKGRSEESLIQPASIDIPCGAVAYQMLGRQRLSQQYPTVEDLICHRGQGLMRLDGPEGAVLVKGQTYLVRCGKVKMPPRHYALLSPKSSIGRCDLLVRAMIDRSQMYDTIEESEEQETLGRGLWVEVTPQSWSVRLREGTLLTQMMVFKRHADACLQVDIPRTTAPLVFGSEGVPATPRVHEGALVLGLSVPPPEEGPVGYVSIPNDEAVLDLTVGANDPTLFFKPVYSQRRHGRERPHSVLLEKDKYYILCTKELVAVPLDVSAEMDQYCKDVGDLRVHYAGFFDPGFGYDGEGYGKPVGRQGVLEVRPHEDVFQLADGNPICMMRFYNNTDSPEKPYGSAGNTYASQSGPRLSKYFSDWPTTTDIP